MMQQGIIRHGGHGNYALTTFGNIIIGNVFRLVNTCIENARELEVIDGIDINRFTTVEYIALVEKPSDFLVPGVRKMLWN
jgi:hypothetical protein